MVKPSWLVYPDKYLLRRLEMIAKLLRDVGDTRKVYRADEWDGVDRGTKYRELAAECDLMIAELGRREIDWYEAYWGEQRPKPGHTQYAKPGRTEEHG